MTSAADLRSIAVGLLATQNPDLTYPTAAGPNVFSPLTRPSWDNSYPVIFLRTPEEEKTSEGRATVQFTVLSTLRVTARVQATTEEACEVQLEALKAQIEGTLINNPALMSLIQQIAFVRVGIDVTARGDFQLGEMMMDLGLEFYQGPEDFYAIPTVPLTKIRIYTDLTNVADPTGTYPPSTESYDPDLDTVGTPFPSNPAPRTEGPDGRIEGGLDLTLEGDDS